MPKSDSVTALATLIHHAFERADDRGFPYSLMRQKYGTPLANSHETFTSEWSNLVGHLDSFELNDGVYGSALSFAHKQHRTFTEAFERTNNALQRSLKLLDSGSSDVELQLIFDEPARAFQRYDEAMTSITQPHLTLQGHQTAFSKLSTMMTLEAAETFNIACIPLKELRDKYFVEPRISLIDEYALLASQITERYLQPYATSSTWETSHSLFWMEQLDLRTSELEIVSLLAVME